MNYMKLKLNKEYNIGNERCVRTKTYTITEETEKAVCLLEKEHIYRNSTKKERNYEEKIWLPKSKIFGFSKKIIIIEAWIAEKRGLDNAEMIHIEGSFDTPQELDDAKNNMMKKMLN